MKPSSLNNLFDKYWIYAYFIITLLIGYSLYVVQWHDYMKLELLYLVLCSIIGSLIIVYLSRLKVVRPFIGVLLLAGGIASGIYIGTYETQDYAPWWIPIALLYYYPMMNIGSRLINHDKRVVTKSVMFYIIILAVFSIRVGKLTAGYTRRGVMRAITSEVPTMFSQMTSMQEVCYEEMGVLCNDTQYLKLLPNELNERDYYFKYALEYKKDTVSFWVTCDKKNFILDGAKGKINFFLVDDTLSSSLDVDTNLARYIYYYVNPPTKDPQ